MTKKKKTKNKKSIKKKQTSKKVSRKVLLVKKKTLSKKKTITSKKKKSLKLRKTIAKKKLVKKTKTLKKELKKTTQTIIKEQTLKKTRVKKEINFDNYIQDIVTKLIGKHKIEGIYTLKIIEKAVPKRFRIPENVNKIQSILKSNKVTIVTEKEAGSYDYDIEESK